MAGIDLSSYDVAPGLGGDFMGSAAGAAGGGSLIDSIFGSVSGNPLGWLNAGSSLLGALGGLKKSEQSGAATSGASQTGLNSSGWVVGKGNAQGGTLETSGGVDFPWYAWAAGTVLIVALIKRGA